MFRYKNIGTVTKTFHGVTFEPGDIKEVSAYINARKFIRVPADPDYPLTPDKSVSQKFAPVVDSTLTTKSAPKSEPKPETKQDKKPEIKPDTSKPAADPKKDDSAETK